MEAIMPSGLGREAEVGDVLFIGYFKTSGSPASNKEPYYALCNMEDPTRVSYVRQGDSFRVIALLHMQFDGKTCRVETSVNDKRSIKERVELAMVFDDSGAQLSFDELPHGQDLRFELLQKSDYFSVAS